MTSLPSSCSSIGLSVLVESCEKLFIYSKFYLFFMNFERLNLLSSVEVFIFAPNPCLYFHEWPPVVKLYHYHDPTAFLKLLILCDMKQKSVVGLAYVLPVKFGPTVCYIHLYEFYNIISGLYKISLKYSMNDFIHDKFFAYRAKISLKNKIFFHYS
ncbi:hypothetical protein HJG60_010923 [Phyllostomus discolor]|uniref:Uncharacterized protein n=1 Tax=Phyllostomus discolor TaxID=89673 RepID=A0A834AE67_9CHIR|nr:hypothetical protein HJG60_010923 [Phyllostomus discolor]